MAYLWLLSQDRRKRENPPFEVHYGTSVPSGSLGSDGDIYIRHDGTVADLFYKKVSGEWVASGGGGGFLGWTGTNSELFELTTEVSSAVVTNFTITTNAKIVVEKDGIKMYEGHGFTRNTTTNAIVFDTAIMADASAKVLVFVGRYS